MVFINYVVSYINCVTIYVDYVAIKNKGTFLCFALDFSSLDACVACFLQELWLRRSYCYSEMKRKASFPFAFPSFFRNFAA